MTTNDNPGVVEEVTQEEEEAYENVFFTSNTLPTANTYVGRSIETTSNADQLKQAIDFFTFLQEEDNHLLNLNLDDVPRTALIGLPGSNNVKLIYGIGVGASGIGHNSPTDGKLLALHGDGGHELGSPHPLVLPIETFDITEVAVMTDNQFTTAATLSGPEHQHPLLARRHITGVKPIMQLAPIPAFMVYDGINQDLHAGTIIERLMAIETNGIDMYNHLKSFLYACLASHNQQCNKPYIAQEHLFTQPANPARLWAADRFKKLFPQLNPAQAVLPPTADNNEGLAAILAQFLPLQQQALQLQTNHTRQGRFAEEKKDDDSTTLGMSQQEFESTLIMCGKDPSSHYSLLPQWFQDCAEKGMTDSFRMRIIRKHIMLHQKYDDAEIPITATLLKNINKRNWLGKDGNIKRPSLLNASEGLSPFIVLDLDEDEVARINDTEDALTRASAVTMQDIANLKKKLIPKIPATADDFMLLLKRYANLLFALFSEDCPFYKCVVKIVDALKEFSRVAREAMSTITKASILWIILLQSRTFALGDDVILAEFTTMHANLASKQGNIYHAEVPQALLPKSLPEKRKPKLQEPDDSKPDIKKPRCNPNNWHPTLKAKLSIPMAKAGFPTFTQIMQYVDKDPQEIISDKSSWCTPNAFFGRCYFGDKCKRQHKIVTDVQAEKIVVLLQKFIDHPEELRMKG
jgi:hypothetical protein